MDLVSELTLGSPTPLADENPLRATRATFSTSSEVEKLEEPKPRPAVQAATFVASKRDPARWAKVVTLASRWGLQPDFVDRNFDELSAEDVRQARAQQHADLSPTLANWLSDPDNATLATHELPSLARVDAGAKLVAPHTQRPADEGDGFFGQLGTASATGAADLGSAAGHLAIAWGRTSPREAARFVADMNTRAAFLREQAPSYAKDFQAAMREHSGDVDKAFRSTLDNRSVFMRTDVLGALARIADPSMHAGQDVATLGEILGTIGAAITRPRGLGYAGVEGLASMAPMLSLAMAGGAAGAAVGSLVPVVGTAIGGTVGAIAGTFAGMAPVTFGAEMNAELTKRGIDITNEAQLERAFSDPVLMAAVRSKAEKAGITNALVASLFTGFAGKIAMSAKVAGAGKAAVAGAYSADVAVQSAGQGVAHGAGQAAKGEEVSVGDALATAIQTLGVSIGAEAIGVSRRAAFHRDPVEAAMQATRGADDALRAHHDAQALVEIGDAVKEAATTAQVPERIKALVETATGGEGAATVFFQADDWNAYWSSRGASPAKAAADILGDGGKAYYESQTTGAPLAVPLADYVSRVAPTEHWEGLLPSARTKPDGMSFKEAAEYLAELPATMREIAEDAVTQPKEKGTESNGDSAAQVGATVRAQLEGAGLSESAARAHASLYEATFRTLGRRAKIHPAELFDRYSLSIQRGRASAAIMKAAEAARAAEAELTALAADEPESAAKLARARTDSGRLKNLKKATDDELANEYATLVDANAQEFTGGISITDEHRPGNAPWVGRKTAQAQALGRVQARAKSIAKLEQELARRGIEHGDAYMRGYQNIKNVDPTEFAFSLDDASSFQQAANEPAPVAIRGDEFGGSDIEIAEVRKAAFDYAIANLKDKVVRNADTGIEIRISPKGLRKVRAASPQRGRFSREQLATFAVLDQLLERAHRTGITENSDVNQRRAVPRFHTFEAPITIGDETLVAKLTVRELIKDGHLYYYHEIAAGEKIEPAATSEGATGPASGSQRQQAIASDALKNLEQAAGGGKPPRGQIVFGEKGVSIELLEKADRTTLIHETGHFYFRVMEDVASAADAPAELVADLRTIREWVGAEDGTPLTRTHHEQIARGFEAYFMEGKAPSPALRGVFYRFRGWLVGVYRQLSALNVTLTPEVRRVFDRLLASEDEIAQAERDARPEPLFDDPKAVGLNDTQAAAYNAAIADAHQTAVEELTTRMMRDIRREESKEWAALRKPIEDQVRAEIDESPVYRALEFLRKGTHPDGSPLPEDVVPLKLSRDEVTAMVGKDAADTLPRSLFAGAGDGVHPDLVAELFGFESGRDLVDALIGTPPRTQALRDLTDQRMRLAHGERMSDAEVVAAATQAIHNEKRSAVLRKEVELLASNDLPAFKGLVRTITKKVPPSAEVKRQASEIIGAKAVREIRPGLFEKAAAKHGREARDLFLKGDLDGAFEAKRKELLTTEVANAAAKAREQIDGALDEFKKVFRRDNTLAETRDLDLVNAARAILAAHGIGRTDKPPTEYLEAMRRYDPEQYEVVRALVADATEGTATADYKSLTFADFSTMREAVSSLWTLSRRTRQIEIDGQKLDRQFVEAELGARLTALTAPGDRAGYARAVTTWEKATRTLMSGRAWLRRVEHWVDAMDGGDPNGVFRRYVWTPISEATSRYRGAKRDALAQYLTIAKQVEGTMSRGAIPAPEIGYEFRNKAELLGALLHTGNASNLRKLLAGRQWGALSEEGILDTSRWDSFLQRMWREGRLQKADYDYAQGVWDLLEGIKPDAQRAHREMFGHYFSEITADEVTTPFGQYRGGYFPAKADPFIVTEQAIKRDAETLLGSDNSFMFPTTGRGFTKQRVEYNRPLIIDARYVPSAIDAVLRFTHIEPRVRDVARVMVSRGFRETLDAFDPTVGGEMLTPWLQRAAQQAVQIPGKWKSGDVFWNELRRRTGLQILAVNVVNSVQQLTGASISAVKVPLPSLGRALWRYVREPKVLAAEIAEKSPFMDTRMTNHVAEVQRHIDELLLDPTKYERARSFAEKHGHFLTAATQGVVDTVTWAGAYEHAIAVGKAEKEAVRIADAVVRETQGSGAPEDLARFEAQSPFMRTLTMFSGYFNMQANLLGTEFANTTRQLGLKKGAGRLLAVYVLGFAIPAVVSQAIQEAANGRPFDEDDDGPIDDVLNLFFGSQFTTLTRMVPVAGPAAELGVKHLAGGAGNDRLSTSAAVQAVERAVAAPGDVYRAIRDRQISTKGIKDILTAIGLVTGLPVAPLAKPVGYLNDVNNGRAPATGPIDVTRGLLTGQPGARP